MQAEPVVRPAPTSADGRLRAVFTPEISRTIRIARVMCITMMMTVHVWPGLKAIVSADVPPALHWFYVIFIKEFGLASVPLLSIVSGLLFYRSARSSTWSELLSGKARTLLVPMVAWSAILLVMFVVKSWAVGDRAFFDVPAMEWINRLFALTAPPINHPLAFLRDIFMCCVIGVVAVRMERALPWSGRALIVALAAAEVFTGGILLLRPQILLFFGLGVFIAMTPPRSLVLPWAVVGALVAVDLVVEYGPFGLADTWTDHAALLHRFAVAMLMWRLAISIVRRDGWLCALLERTEPMIFLVFCSHILTISVMAVLFSGLGLWVDSTIYPLVFALQIPVIYGVAVLLQALGQAYAPRLLAVMSARKHEPAAAEADPKERRAARTA